MTTATKVLAWHFLADSGLMRDGKRAEVGQTYKLARGKPVLCERGYHGSVRPLDALRYAPGCLVSRVEIGGEIVTGDDKLCGTERTVLWMADATTTLHEFSAWAAEWILDRLEAKGYKIDPHSRGVIEAKRRWLRKEITDAELDAARDAAWAAAWDAAWAAAWDAARDAARVAARDAARVAARDAARVAAWAAARVAAWAAARDAARVAAWAAAWDAAWAAAWVAAWAAARDAARVAAWAAAWDAAGDALNTRLEGVLTALEPVR